MNLYAESSAILSWLLGEDRRNVVRRLLGNAELIMTSELTLIECERVLLRGMTLKEITENEADDRRKRLQIASAGWHILRVNAEVVSLARQPFPAEPIRTLDAIHLASAIVGRTAIPDLAILSLDNRIRTAARLADFKVLPKQTANRNNP